MIPLTPTSRPVLAPHVYLRRDPITGGSLLIFPENLLELNDEAEAIVARCDGRRSVAEIVAELADEFEADPSALADDVNRELEGLCQRRLLALDAVPRVAPLDLPMSTLVRARKRRVSPYRPLALLAELTYRCPLHCPYCSNPTRYPIGELRTEEWARVFAEAAELGVLHVGLSGGEPVLRPDLAELIGAAAGVGLYTNLVTSGLGVDEQKLAHWRAAGLESIQLSYQSDEAPLADRIAGAKAHAAKLKVAALIRSSGISLSLNVVLHRENIDRLPQIITLAEAMEGERLELANVQYYGWGFRNRTALLPTRAQVERARGVAEAAQARLAGRMDVFYVLPDLYETRPKPCMQGWGQRYLTVNPAGEVLPCPTANGIPGLRFDNVRDRALAWIWESSESFKPLPRHSVDAAALPGMSTARDRLRRLPLSGGVADGRSGLDRSGVRFVAQSRVGRPDPGRDRVSRGAGCRDAGLGTADESRASADSPGSGPGLSRRRLPRRAAAALLPVS